MSKRRGGLIKKYNSRILGAANDPCVICGGNFESIDHIIPVSKKGPLLNHLNWAPMCTRCNNMKDNSTVLFALLNFRQLRQKEILEEQERQEEFERNKLVVCSWLQ